MIAKRTITTRIKAATRAVAIGGALAGAMFGLAAQASADPVHHHHLARHASHHHGHRVIVGGPAYVATPAYQEGLEQDSPEDGLAVGREGPVPGPHDVGPGVAIESTSPNGYEIEGPPISPSLPNLPVLTPELLN